MKEKKYRASITTLALVIILNLILFSASIVFAAPPTVVVGDAKSKIHEAVRAKYIAAAFVSCFRGDDYAFHEEKFGFIPIPKSYITVSSISKNKGNLFKSYGSDARLTSVGPELRKEIYGKASSGEDPDIVQCQENGSSNITKAFMSQFGIQDLSDLICDKDSKQNGLLMPKKNGNISTCEEGTLDALGQFDKNPDGEKYIKKIYDKWAKNNAFAVPYDKLYSYYDDPTLAYDDALTTFELNCSPGAAFADSVDISTYNFKIKLLNSDGKVVEKYPKMITTTEKDGSKKSTDYVDANHKALNCNELANVINSSFDQYAKNLSVAEADACNSQEVIDKASKIVRAYSAKYNARVPLTEEEKEEHKILSEALQKKDFTVDDGKGGKKCLDTANLKISVKDTASDDDSDIAPDNDLANDAKQSYCQENGGFLSWMLCPTIADGAATASGLLGTITKLTATHDSIIEQFSDQNSAIYKAWSAFRNLANIGFVIMLLVVVFSQVTNLGISNYNIKKILPKLIITAILVNFSYLILGVAIDLSHIIGNGIGSAIRTIAGDSMSAEASAQASATISKIAGLVTGAGLGVAAATAVTTGPAIILSVVMFVVSAAISVFFGFIMLTIRQAAIIMVIVLAPLAMVLYALPNTAAITKKYMSTLKALLMLYPMFILATSAGALASSIIVGTSQDILMLIVGGLLNVLPYFAIPSMTSKSLAGLGAITSGFDKLRSGALKGVGMAGGAIAATEAYKNLKNDYRADQDINRAAKRLRRYRDIEEGGGTLSTAQKRRQSESANILMKDAKMRAGGRSAAGIALSNYEGTGFAGLQAAAQNELMEAEDKNNMMLFDSKGYTPDDMIDMLKSASAADYTKMTDTEKNANDSLIRSLTKSLMSTKAGQKAFELQIASDKNMRLSNRAFGQIAHAALKTPGLADKYQVMNNQFGSYVDGGGDTSGTEVRAGLMGSSFSNGIRKTLTDMNSDKLQKITKFEVKKMYESGADTTNLDNAFNMLAAASIKDPNLIADFDGIKQQKILEAQNKYVDESQKSTINLRSGGAAQVYNPPADFGKYTQTKDAAGQIFYTNDRGDIFNASTGEQIRNI